MMSEAMPFLVSAIIRLSRRIRFMENKKAALLPPTIFDDQRLPPDQSG
jgi:hypothetical protein